ncbi:RING/FYVE/PHD zinc finger superfamily protein [Euphorbia peplus]|nr:RING/FYVE/PHD zinc finger superfamily protein [Euphorbia peplus]
MGDHFVLLVDRLLTESTLEAAIASRNQYVEAQSKTDLSYHHTIDFEDIISTPKKIVECRICQDEDVDSNMETPCSCSGSLKYAHRRCIQRWCNEKGNTMCEICHQQFKPGYTAPPPLFRIGRLPMNLRRGSHGPRLIAMVSTDRNFLHSDGEDYPTSTWNMICCRTLLIAFMILLVLRHTLPVILSGSNVITFPLLMLVFLRIAGIVIPIYVMVRVVGAIQRRFQQEPPDSGLATDDEEAEQPSLQA